MINKKWFNLHLILGIIAGFLLSQFVLAEGFAILVGINNDISINVNFTVKFIALVVFIITILIFNSKRFKRINLNKISIYLILSVIISLFMALESVFIITYFVMIAKPNIGEFLVNNYFLSVNLTLLLIFLGVSIFLIVFLLLVNRKVKYIKFLTKEVKVIKNEGFGKTIEVKGNDELTELCNSINNMSLELREKIDKEKFIENNKNELITNVSHDLRTPLTSIIGYVDLLKKNGITDKEKFNEYINVIDERAKSLNTLINELFEYTKLTSHDIKLNYNEIEISSLIEQLIGEYIPIFNNEGLQIEKDICKEDIFINVDVEKIVRVFQNLLTNAVKYSMKNTVVYINLTKENNNLIFSIKNKTNNLSSEHIENIFERFYKADKSRKDSDSSGLGLSIVKKIVELHNGSTVASLNDNIVQFKITLPI